MHLGAGEGRPEELEVVAFHEVGGDWWVVAGLLPVYWDTGDTALEGLPQGRVEWFLGFHL